MMRKFTSLLWRSLPGILLLAMLPVLALAVPSPLSPSTPAPDTVLRRQSLAELYHHAAVFAQKVPVERAPYLLSVSLSAKRTYPARLKALQALGFVLNSLSTNTDITLPNFVPDTEGALAWFDLSTLRERDDHEGRKRCLAAWQKLGELGSGIAPFHEPYFTVPAKKIHGGEETEYETIEYGYYVDRDGVPKGNDPGPGLTWKTTSTKKVPRTKTTYRGDNRLSPSTALKKADVLTLSTLTRNNFPIFDYRWLCYNALVEPRYHELLGLDETEESVLRLAAVQEKTADRLGAQCRGAVLFSEVGNFKRILERTGTLRRYGRGSFHRSLDFLSAIGKADVLSDVLNNEPDAYEIIFTLPNGLQGFSVVQGKPSALAKRGQRLDKADADIAQNHAWKDNQVRTAFQCMDCHLREKGWIEVQDQVRDYAREKLSLASQALVRSDDGELIDRGKKIRQKYLSIDYNELLQQDQAILSAAVLTATGGGDDITHGLTPSEVRKEVIDTIKEYIQGKVSAEQLAWELGVSEEVLLDMIQRHPGLHHSLAGLLTGTEQRRDDVEVAFGQIATILYLTGRK